MPNDAPNFQICFLTDKDGGRVARPFKGYHRVAIDRRTIETHNDTENDTAQSDCRLARDANTRSQLEEIGVVLSARIQIAWYIYCNRRKCNGERIQDHWT